MNYRFMRIIVMFDLPMNSLEDQRNYTEFRKCLISNGFLMLQKSVYCKMSINLSKADSVIQTIRKSMPRKGLIQILVITEKQFSSMQTYVGKMNPSIIDGDQGVIII